MTSQGRMSRIVMDVCEDILCASKLYYIHYILYTYLTITTFLWTTNKLKYCRQKQVFKTLSIQVNNETWNL